MKKGYGAVKELETYKLFPILFFISKGVKYTCISM